MKNLILLLALFVAPFARANSGDETFEAATLARFTAHLERILPSDARAAQLRTDAREWMQQFAARTRVESTLPETQSVLPWSAAGEKAFTRYAQARADKIRHDLTMRFLHGTIENGSRPSVLAEIAKFYATLATLATYRGNQSAQLVVGSVLALVPGVILGTGTFIITLGPIFANAPFVDLAEAGQAVRTLNLALTIEAAAYGGVLATLFALPSGRDAVRRLGQLNERDAAARRIEAAFWDALRRGFEYTPELRELVPATGSDGDFAGHVFGRLHWLGGAVEDCEIWLKQPISE